MKEFRLAEYKKLRIMGSRYKYLEGRYTNTRIAVLCNDLESLIFS